MTYQVRLILHQIDNRPCCDVDNPSEFDTAFVLLYGEHVMTPGDNGPFPCRHGKDSIIRTCKLEVPE